MYTKLAGILDRGRKTPITEGTNPKFSVDLKIKQKTRSLFTLVAVVTNCGASSAVNVDVIVNGVKVGGTAVMQSGSSIEIKLGDVICTLASGYRLAAGLTFDPNYSYDKELQIIVADCNGDGCSFIPDIQGMMADATRNGI